MDTVPTVTFGWRQRKQRHTCERAAERDDDTHAKVDLMPLQFSNALGWQHFLVKLPRWLTSAVAAASRELVRDGLQLTTIVARCL